MINHRTRECKLIFFDYVKVQARMGVHNFAHPPCKKIRQESVGQKLKKFTTLADLEKCDIFARRNSLAYYILLEIN